MRKNLGWAIVLLSLMLVFAGVVGITASESVPKEKKPGQHPHPPLNRMSRDKPRRLQYRPQQRRYTSSSSTRRSHP